MTRAAFRVRSHSSSEEETVSKLAAIDLNGVVDRVTCPVYVVGGELDRIVPPQAAHQIADGVSGPCQLNVVAGGNHVASNKTYLYRPQSTDWMAAHLLGDGAASS
jgi:cephalosporin-C deacetylase-like acetyl esterase